MKEKFTQHEKYRQSEQEYLPKIPAHWSVMRIKYLFKEINERVFNETLDLLSVSHYTGVTLRKSSVSEGDNLTNAKSLEGYKRVEKDDIVSNIMLAWNGSIGISKYLGITSPAYSIYRLKKEGNPNYFHYLFRTQLYKSEFKKNSTGVIESRLRLYTDQFFNINAIVPPPQEQTAIADFLDQKTAEIDNYIRLKEKTIALLEERKATVINQAVTKGLDPTVPMKDSGIEWLGEIPAHWEVKKLKYLKKVISKGTTPSTEGRGMTDAGIRYLKAENIKNSRVSDFPAFFIDEETNKILKRSQLKENDILFVIAGATIGKTAVLEANFLPANTNQAISFIRLKKNENVDFTHYALGANFVYKQIWLNAVQSAQPNLSMENLGNFSFPYPNDKEKREIVVFLKKFESKINKEISLVFNEITLIKEYRESLISAAVTGKIDIRNYHLKTAENVETARN